jgi:putative peptidoglycan lipid II flippase
MASNRYRKIGAAALIMMASIFLSRFMGLFREMTIAAIGGADAAVDAYRVAFVLPEILNHILASGFLSVTFIPIFARYLAEEDEAGGWHTFSVVLTVFGLALLVLIVLAMLLAPQLVALLAPGRDDPSFQGMAVRMTRIILPAQFFFFTGGLFTAVQFARERFAIPALAPLIYNLGIIAGGALLGSRFGMEGFSWGVLAGAFTGNFLLQWVGARKVGMRFRPRFEFRHPDLLKYIWLTLPLMLGLTMTFSTEIFSKFFGSYLQAGAISWIDYGMRIMLMLVAFFGQAVGVASYPFMAKLAAEDRIEEMNRLLNATLRYLGLVIPFSALIMVLRKEVVAVIYQRARFTLADTEMTAAILVFLLLGAVAFSAQTVVNRGFYAMQNTLSPAIYGTITAVLSIPIYAAGLTFMGVRGVGLAVSLAAIFQVAFLFSLWNRKSRNRGGGDVYRFYLKVIAASLPMGILLELIRRGIVNLLHPEGLMGSLVIITVTGACFIVLLFAAARVLGINEIRDLSDRLRSRLRSNPSG